MSDIYQCAICKELLDEAQTYEYRGAFACDVHFDELMEVRDDERERIIAQESSKTEPLRGLDLSDSVIGKANKKLLSTRLEMCRVESNQLKRYEGRKND